MNCHREYTALLWAAVLFHNCGLPMKCILPNWTCRILSWRVTGHITKFIPNPFQRHSLCFLSDSSWSQCVLKGPAKTPIYLVAGKGSLFISHWLCRHRCLLVNREVRLGWAHLQRVHGGRGDEQWRCSDSDKRRVPSKWMKETIQMSGPFFFKYTLRSGMAGSFASSLFRFRGTSLLLSTMAAPVDIPTNSVQIFSTCSPTFLTSVPFG